MAAEPRTRPEFPARPSAAVRRAFSLIERECPHGLAGKARLQVHRRLGDVLGRGSWAWDEKRGPFKLTAGDLTLVQEIVETEVPKVLRRTRRAGETGREYLDRRAKLESMPPEESARYQQDKRTALEIAARTRDSLANDSRGVLWRYDQNHEEIETAVYVLLVRARNAYRAKDCEKLRSGVTMRDALEELRTLASDLRSRTRAGRAKRLERMARFLEPRKELREKLAESWGECHPAVVDAKHRLVPHPVHALRRVLHGERVEEWESPLDWKTLVDQVAEALEGVLVVNVRPGDPKRRRSGRAVRALIWAVCDLVWALGQPVTTSMPGTTRGRSTGRRGGALVGRVARLLMADLSALRFSSTILSSAVREWHERRTVPETPFASAPAPSTGARPSTLAPPVE